MCFTLSLSAEKPTPMTPEFHQTIFIGKPAKEVWDALTTKTTVDQYYMAPLLVLDLKKGGRIAYGRETAMIEGMITELDASRKLSHSFRFAASTGPETLVAYEVEPVGDAMCALHLTHSGFKKEDQTFADITGGWPVILSSLKTLLETGKPLPWPKD
jgi:uncharacterized protein YndB with AHSA1/START domain